MRVTVLLLAAGTALSLAACSSHRNHHSAPPPTAVHTAQPVQQTFYAKVAAFGELATDGRTALTLSLPQPGLVTATNVLAGQEVKRDAPLLTFATNPAARNAYLTAQNAVKIARANLTQIARLHTGRLATTAQLDAARQALADAQTALAAQAKLGGAHAVTVLRAPAAGVVTALLVQRGQRVPAGTSLVQFSPSATLAAQLGVDPAGAASIHTGMPASLHPVYGAQGAAAIPATVAMVGHAVNPATHLISVVATLDKGTSLPAGTALAGNVKTTRFTAWAVPRTALERDAHGSYLFQIVDGKAKRVNVRVLSPAGSPVGIAGEINPHAPVITLGSYEVSNGDPVHAIATVTPTAHGAITP